MNFIFTCPYNHAFSLKSMVIRYFFKKYYNLLRKINKAETMAYSWF